jgi:hypothetical protein
MNYLMITLLKKKNIFFCAGFIFFLNFYSYPQTVSDSLDFLNLNAPINELTLGFEKQLSTYSLTGDLSINKLFDNILLKLNEDYNSSVIKSSDRSVRDEHNFVFSSAYKPFDDYSLGVTVSNKILSDSRQIEINQASQSSVIIYNDVNPYDKIYLSPFGGYVNDRQIGNNNYGTIYGLEGVVDSLPLSGFDLVSNLKYENEDILPRRNLGRLINVVFINNSNNQIANMLNLQFQQNRNDYYYEADPYTASLFNITDNIQSRTETIYDLNDNINYGNFLSIFTLEAKGNLYLREIDRDTRYRSAALTKISGYDPESIFDTNVDELKIEFEGGLNYTSQSFNTEFKFNYSERDEKHITKNFPGVDEIYYEERSDLENQKNNNAITLSAALTGNIYFSRTDALNFSFYQNKLEYNTPSDENFDDRDELLSIIKLKYSKLLNPFFSVFVSTEGTMDHLVYIYSEESSNNNINRIIRLSSGSNYMGKNVYSYNYFEVSANYTVYDFEDLNPNYRSYSFRQYTGADSTIIKLTNHLGIKHYGYIKLSEQGDLQWASFSTTPNRYLQEIYTEPELTYNYNIFQTGLGIRFYSIKTYNYIQSQKVLQSNYNSIGPSVELGIILNNLFVKVNGWYEFIKTDENPIKQQASMFFQMKCQF